jgi:hypothetical protein
MSEDIFTAMQKDPQFQSDLLIIEMIKKDIYIAGLKLEIDPTKLILNGDLYDFNSNNRIFEVMGFSQKEIDEEISLWYYFQIKKVLEELKYRKMSEELLHDRAMKLYYDLKKQKTSE